MIDKITQEIFKILDRLTLNDVNGLVGIEDRVKRIESRLHAINVDDDVRILGIWGMGGIGKTTVATTLFHKIKNKFDGYGLLENVRENSGKNGHKLPKLRKKLLSQVMHDENLQMNISRGFLQDRLRGRKVLIFLDDIDDMEQLENLVDEVYDYAKEQLSDEEALLLFSHHVFKTSQPPTDFLELSRKAINYASGIPLALKLFGSHLRNKDEQTWISALAKLEKNSDKKMLERILGVSFEGLESNEKDILLDVACFYKGEDVKYASSVWDACGFFSHDAISVLSDKCLISIRCSVFCMHDLIQEMCKEKVREENVEPGARSRLWQVEDIFHVFNKNTGTSNLQCIILDLSEANEVLKLRKDAFVKMEKLRLLKFSIDSYEINTKVKLPRGLTMLPESLRYLFWDRYPNDFLPSEFDGKNIVEVSLRQSCIKQLKKEPKMLIKYSSCMFLKNVKRLDLSCCTALSNLSADIGNMVHLCKLSLHGTGVSNLPSSIGNLSRLIELDLSYCKKLASLPDSIGNLKLLQELYLRGCESLQHLQESIGNLESLIRFYADDTSIKRVPLSILYLKNIRVLSFQGCRGIKESSTRSCLSVQLFPLEAFGEYDSIITPILEMGRCNFVQLPSFLHYFTTLGYLDLSGNNFDALPQTIFNNFYRLFKLDLSDCKRLQSLPDLPSSLQVLSASRCTSLESITSIETLLRGVFVGAVSKPTDPKYFDFGECSKIKNQVDNILKSLFQWLRLLEKKAQGVYADGGQRVNVMLLYPGDEIPKWFSNEGNNTVTLQLPHHYIDSVGPSFYFSLSHYESMSLMRIGERTSSV